MSEMRNFIKEIKNEIKDMVFEAYKEAFMETKLDKLSEFVCDVEIPKEKQNGNFSVNFAMRNAKQLKKAPREVAQIIVDKIFLEGTMIEKCEVAGPGFINFYLKDEFFTKSSRHSGCTTEHCVIK